VTGVEAPSVLEARPPLRSRERHGTVQSRVGRIGRVLVNAAAGFGLLYLFLPIFVIVLFSFNDPAGRFNAVWQRFTLDNWLDPFSDQALVDSLLLSLQIALVSTVIATILGTFVAIALVRYRFHGGGIVNYLLVLPLTTAEIVLGASLLTLFLEPHLVLFNIDFRLGVTTIILAHVMFLVSYVALTVKARVRGFDWTLEDAAMDLGAPPVRTFFRITLPLIMPGILAAFLLGFALSIDDFIITYFVAGPTEQTFPIRIFGQSRTATPPQINVLATMILVVSVTIMVVGTWFGQRRRRRMGMA
jgi:spermidine/putrescine transport system permease protein